MKRKHMYPAISIVLLPVILFVSAPHLYSQEVNDEDREKIIE